MAAINDFEVFVEIYESKHKFVINEYHKKWTKLKQSIARHINAIVGQRLDFNNHRFEIWNDSTNAYIPLDQPVYDHFARRQNKIRILVTNRLEDKRKPTNSVMKEWKNVHNGVNSEEVAQEINGSKQLNDQKEDSDLLLARVVVKRMREPPIDWEQVSKLMERQLFTDWDPIQCQKAFSALIKRFIKDLKTKTSHEMSDSCPAYRYLMSTELRQLSKNLQLNAIEVKPSLIIALNDFIDSQPKPKAEPLFKAKNSSVNKVVKNHILVESRLSTERKLIPIRNYCETQIDWFSSPDNASPPTHGI